LAMSALVVLLLVGPGGRAQTDARAMETVTQESLASRMELAASSLAMLRDFPLFGVGLGCWPEVFPRYRQPPWSPTFWNATHNDYVQMATETG
jgi:O-antigen ligase